MTEMRTWTAAEMRALVADNVGCMTEDEALACADSVLAALGIDGDVTVVPGRLEQTGVRDENGHVRPLQDAPLFRGDEPLYRVVPPHVEPMQP